MLFCNSVYLIFILKLFQICFLIVDSKFGEHHLVNNMKKPGKLKMSRKSKKVTKVAEVHYKNRKHKNITCLTYQQGKKFERFKQNIEIW